MDDTLEELLEQRSIRQNVGHRKSGAGGRAKGLHKKQSGWRVALRMSLLARNKKPLLPLPTK